MTTRGEPLPDAALHALQHLGARPEKVDPQVVAVGELQEALEEVDTGDALGELPAEQAARPDDGLPVGEDDVAVEKRGPQQLVAAQLDDLGGVDHPDQHAAAAIGRHSAPSATTSSIVQAVIGRPNRTRESGR